MLAQYISRALENAHYEIIDDEEPYYGEVPGLKGVWASASTLEECRRELERTIEDWLLFSVAKGLPVPSIDGIEIRAPEAVSGQ